MGDAERGDGDTRMWSFTPPPIEVYPSPEAAQAAMNAFSRGHGYALVVKRTIPDKKGKCRRVIYACDRHGKRKKYTPQAGTIRRPNAATRKCDCPMEINLIRRNSEAQEEWIVEYRGTEEQHNHPPSDEAASHPIHRRADLTSAISETIATDAHTGTRAAQTLARISSDHPDTAIIPRDVYNARRKAEVEMLDGCSRIEYVLSSLSDEPFFVQHKKDTNDRLSHLFFGLEEAISIFKSNSDVILMDCTYKTNRFGMPLLNMIGTSGMNTTLHLAQAFMIGETFEDYEWVLQQLSQALIDRDIHLPQIFFVDRDLALLNALEKVFPTVPVLLCIWHIIKDVESHARKNGLPQVLDEAASTVRVRKYMDSAAHRAFCDEFISLTRARTVSEYHERRQRLHALCSSEADYIDKTWLDIWHQRIVRCWTNELVHFGLQTTSRVEGYHASLKLWLNASTGDLLTFKLRMVHWWRLSVHKYKKAVSDSKIKVPASLRGELFVHVLKVIHAHALRKCLEQLQIIRSGACTGVFSKCMGIPCVHKLRELMRTKKSLKPTDFHPHWWIDRTAAPVCSVPVVLEPLTIAERRAEQRAATAKSTKRHTRGSGPHGTRRVASAFERRQATQSNLSNQDSDPGRVTTLPPLAASLHSGQRPPRTLPSIRHNPYLP